MALKLRQIEAFRAVMREGSMVRASSVMSITQPAVSYLIASFEAAVGFPLFSRQGGRLSATPEALQLMTEVDRLYEGLDAIEAAAQRIANFDKAVVRILMSQATAASQILATISRFAAAHPGLKLDLDVDHRSTIVHRVNSGQVDLGIVSITTDMESISTRLFSSELVCLSATPGHLDGCTEVTPGSLIGIPIVTLRPSGLVRRIVDKWFAQSQVNPNYVIEAGDPAMAIELVRGGLGVTFVGSLSVADRPNSGLTTIPMNPAQAVDIGAITPTLRHPNRAVKAIVQLLKAASPA